MSKKPSKEPPKEAGAPKAKSGMGGIVGFAMLGAAAVASSFGVSFFLTPSASDPTLACTPGAAPAIAAPAAGKTDMTYVQLQDVLITIGSAPATRYLKMTLAIATDPESAAAVKVNEPLLIDAFNNYLRSVEVSDFEDPGFYIHMREQLSRRSELILGDTASQGVLITEFLLR